jgi:hypothetical protein
MTTRFISNFSQPPLDKAIVASRGDEQVRKSTHLATLVACS